MKFIFAASWKNESKIILFGSKFHIFSHLGPQQEVRGALMEVAKSSQPIYERRPHEVFHFEITRATLREKAKYVIKFSFNSDSS